MFLLQMYIQEGLSQFIGRMRIVAVNGTDGIVPNEIIDVIEYIFVRLRMVNVFAVRG